MAKAFFKMSACNSAFANALRKRTTSAAKVVASPPAGSGIPAAAAPGAEALESFFHSPRVQIETPRSLET
jgi:hypothetical protein